MKKINPSMTSSKIGGSIKKFPTYTSMGNYSRHSHRSSRSFMGSSSRQRVNVQGDKVLEKGYSAGGKHTIQVLDENGKDVTPHPLILLDPSLPQAKQSKIFSSQDLSFSDFALTATMYQTITNASFAGPFTRSTFESGSVSRSSRTFSDSMDEIVEPGVQQDVTSLQYVQVRREDVREQLNEDDLNKIVDVYLTETETFSLLDLPVEIISVDSGEAEAIKKRNQLYIELCKERVGNDRYIERMAQTFGGAQKSKEVQCDKINTKDAGVMATTWDMYDSFKEEELHEEASFDHLNQQKDLSQAQINFNKTVLQTLSALSSIGLESRSTSSAESESIVTVQGTEELDRDPEELLKNEKLKQDLFIMERVIMENIFQPKLAAYRQLPILPDPNENPNAEEELIDSIMLLDIMSPRLQPLWSFTCSLTKGRNVSCMVWNKHNVDLLAVGYGQFGYKEQKGGLICCWSLKNPMPAGPAIKPEKNAQLQPVRPPNLLGCGSHMSLRMIIYATWREVALALTANFLTPRTAEQWRQKFHILYRAAKWPERIYNCESGVTALEFSADTPNLLAVGHYDGTVAVYNIRNPEDGLILDSSNDLNKHIGPVWQLKWTEQDRNSKGDEKEGTLISIAADGRVAKWNLGKGLESSDLMRIKRTGMHTSKKETNDKEKKSEASISRQAPGMCFAFHPKGPVYKVTWSPFSLDTFLSCSADWSIHVWSQEILKPVLRFSSTITKAVHDIMWSPKSATMFGAVNEDRVEIWDLGVSILDPVVICPANEGLSLSTLLFAKNTDCMLIGDNSGQVIVYELHNMPEHHDSMSLLNSIITSTLASQLISDAHKDSTDEPIINICDIIE
ncbi:dynein axonemal intermediate chain 4 isoform X2 [Heptranchias perlo]|uniref:dynein axonemal intermediate chain 4 isoform X2 n=1 Tax=Heptranchias perlo TaxID=212740 RepID=UPI00355A24DF